MDDNQIPDGGGALGGGLGGGYSLPKMPKQSFKNLIAPSGSMRKLPGVTPEARVSAQGMFPSLSSVPIAASINLHLPSSSFLIPLPVVI